MLKHTIRDTVECIVAPYEQKLGETLMGDTIGSRPYLSIEYGMKEIDRKVDKLVEAEKERIVDILEKMVPNTVVEHALTRENKQTWIDQGNILKAAITKINGGNLSDRPINNERD